MFSLLLDGRRNRGWTAVFAGPRERRINICMVAKDERLGRGGSVGSFLKDTKEERRRLLRYLFQLWHNKIKVCVSPLSGPWNETFLVILRGKQRAKEEISKVIPARACVLNRKEGRKGSTRVEESVSLSRANCQVHGPLECVAILGKHQSYISNDWNCFPWLRQKILLRCSLATDWFHEYDLDGHDRTVVCVSLLLPLLLPRPILRLSFADNKLHSDTCVPSDPFPLLATPYLDSSRRIQGDPSLSLSWFCSQYFTRSDITAFVQQ